MLDIFKFCERHNIYIISDEVYWNESFSDYEFISFGHLATPAVPVIVLGGLEKTFLVPGWSVSWMLFFDPAKRLAEVKSACEKTAELFEGPCSFMEKALPNLLDTLTPNYTKNFMGLFEDNYAYLDREFKKMPGLIPIPA
jgi:tyrosine aminotransferase